MHAARNGTPILDRRLIQALNHPLRVQLLVEINKDPMSPVEFHRRFGGSLSSIAYHVRELKKLGFLELVDTAARRGSTEHFFRATKRAAFDDECWPLLPPQIRSGFDAAIYRTMQQQIVEAIEAGTMEARPERHFTWTLVKLDEEGWTRIIEQMNDLLGSVQAEEQAAAERMQESGERPIPTTVALAGFESPPAKREAQPS